MKEYDNIVISRDRLPADVSVGDEFYIRVKGRVRRIEAQQIEVTGYTADGSIEVAEGSVAVELTVLAVETQRAI